METKKEFRKKILQLHYDISQGNALNLVIRTFVAEKLGFEDYNDDELLGAIRYLEDKGYLKVATNMEDQITDLGIDEVEESFPNLCLIGDFKIEDKTEEKKEEILKLSPEFHGIGINLRALFRKIKKFFRK